MMWELVTVSKQEREMMYRTRSRTLMYLLLIFIDYVQSVAVDENFRYFVEQVATVYHSNWRENFLRKHPHTRNRFKLTTTPKAYNQSDFLYPMILTVGSCLVHRNLKVAQSRSNRSLIYVDILNMEYHELPSDWAAENRATARVACRLILKNVREERSFNRALIEHMSRRIHFQWMKRNAHRTSQDLLVPYRQLSEHEKDKDRRAILVACRLFNQLHLHERFHTSRIHLIDPFSHLAEFYHK